MSVLLNIVEGWSTELGPFGLKIDGAALDLTGKTVVLYVRAQGGSAKAVPGAQVRIGNATAGELFWQPLATDFKATGSPYGVHWKVIDSDGHAVFFPNGAPDTITVSAV